MQPPDLTQARQQLASGTIFNLCLTDLRLPDGSGIDLVEEIGTKYPNLPVAVITAYGSMETAIRALKAGAFDFITKPINLDNLRQLTAAALKLTAFRQDTPSATTSIINNPQQLLGISPAIQNLRKLISKLARNQAPVHITGESGTGKELVAKLIHTQGPRRDGPFVALNCGAIPTELMESEFFGHKKGSFTGATTDKQGLFQTAAGGTLFLDEVADLPLHMQVKLLRAIQEKTIRPIGSQHEISTNIRLISATHKNIAQLVTKGNFRQDLFYRIHVIGIELPPLRHRPEDIPILAKHLLQRFATQNGTTIPVLTAEAWHALNNHPFPGNVRELSNILERTIAMCESGLVQASDLKLTPPTDTQPQATSQSNSKPHELPTNNGNPPNPLDPPIPPPNNETLGLEASLEQVERQLIANALETTHWNRTAAAKMLGISFRALRYRLQKLGLETE